VALLPPNTKLANSIVEPTGRQAQRGQNYLKAVGDSESPNPREDAEAFQEKVEALSRQADVLAREIASLRWLGLGIEPVSIEGGVDFYQEVRRFEISLIVQALKFTGGSQKKSAHLLRMNHTTLNTKIKAYRIRCEAISVSAGQ
jgi:DNA-binding NtrC family response regulator